MKGPSGTKVRVGEVEATVDSEGNFTAEGVSLSPGTNSIVVKATAPNGKEVEKILELYHEAPKNDDPPDT